MKRLIAFVAFILIAVPGFAKIIPRGVDRSLDWEFTGGFTLSGTIDFSGTTEISGATTLSGTTTEISGDLILTPKADATGTAEGTLYYDSDTDLLTFRNGSSAWVSVPTGDGDNTLDQAYNQGGAGVGRTITADTGAVVITNTDDDTAFVLSLTPTPGGAAASGGLQITVGGNSTEDALQIVNSGSGDDIQAGGGAFTVASDASVSCLDLIITGASAIDIQGSGGITLENGETITNSTDTEFKFTANSEDVSLDLQNTVLAFTSTSGIVGIDWGALDAHTGLNTLAFDAAASTIGLAADSAGQDLTIAVTGAENVSLVLSSEGTGADALQLLSKAGGIHIYASGAASDEDISIVASGSSVNIESTEDDAAAIMIDASHTDGGITVDFGTTDMIITGTGTSADFTVNADLISIDGTGASNFSTTGGAGEDMVIAQIGTAAVSLHLLSAGAAADAISIQASDAAGGIDVDFGTGNLVILGTGVGADFTLDCDLFSIDGTGAANVTVTGAGSEDFTIAQAGTADCSLFLLSAGTGTDAIKIETSNATGDLDINVGDAMTVDAGDVVFTTDDTAADQFKVVAGGAHAGDVIVLATTDGGMSIDVDGAANGDLTIDVESVITLDGADDIVFTLTADASGEDFVIQTSGAQDCHLTLISTGTTADALGIQADGAGGGIDIDTDDGAISIVADGSASGDITIDAEDQITIVSTDSDGTGSIYIHANGGVSEDIKIHADLGTATDSIEIVSDDGGIKLSAGGDIEIASDLDVDANIVGDGGGTIEGMLCTVVNDNDGMAQGVLTAADAGTLITNSGAGGAFAYVLPEASTCIGSTFYFAVQAANELRVDPYDATDRILLVTDTAGDYYSADAVGETLVIMAIAADNWVVVSETGTWTEE